MLTENVLVQRLSQVHIKKKKLLFSIKQVKTYCSKPALHGGELIEAEMYKLGCRYIVG